MTEAQEAKAEQEAERIEELQDHGRSHPTSKLENRPKVSKQDARASLQGALGDLIVKGNALPKAQRKKDTVILNFMHEKTYTYRGVIQNV